MHEKHQKKTFRLRRGMAVFCAALMLCTGRGLAAGGSGESETGHRMLVPVGHTVGIKLYARGVLVVGLPDGATPARVCGLEEGDVILRCSGTAVTSSEHFQSLLQTSGGAALELEVRGSGGSRTVSVTPRENDGVYCIGAWIRDSMAGIGTVTYYDPATGVFGALGHGINDTDTAQLMPFSSGSILPSSVKTIKKGVRGAAGQLKGEFDLTGELGTLYANTVCGVFGRTESDVPELTGDALPAARAEEIQTGPAVIRCNVEGDRVAEYSVELLRLFDEPDDPRDLLLKVTDPALLNLTGGIVQGMSGSPIIQDGKLVGAVTHVLLNDPTRGYGISIETMLAAAE